MTGDGELIKTSNMVGWEKKGKKTLTPEIIQMKKKFRLRPNNKWK